MVFFIDSVRKKAILVKVGGFGLPVSHRKFKEEMLV